LLDALLKLLAECGLVKSRRRLRTDSTHVLADVCGLNQLERVGETLRAALNELAVMATSAYTLMGSVFPPPARTLSIGLQAREHYETLHAARQRQTTAAFAHSHYMLRVREMRGRMRKQSTAAECGGVATSGWRKLVCSTWSRLLR